MSERISPEVAKRILDIFFNGDWIEVDDNIGPYAIRINGEIIRLWLVCQNIDYAIESERGHVFGPIKGHPKMKEVRARDIIFSYEDKKIRSINVALESAEETYGVVDGYRIDCMYSQLNTPLDTVPLRPVLLHYNPFAPKGYIPTGGYIHPLDSRAARIMMGEIKRAGNTPRK